MLHLSSITWLMLFTVCALLNENMARNVARTSRFLLLNYFYENVFTLALNSCKGVTDKSLLRWTQGFIDGYLLSLFL